MFESNWKGSLKERVDAYHGLHLTIGQAPSVAQLTSHLTQLELSKQYRTIWLQLSTRHFQLLDVCTNKLGYKVHHGLAQTIVIYKWLSNRSDKVVPYSVFCLAAGALVIHNNRALLVQENSGTRKGRYGLPGGRADRGQLIGQCAQRQLFEETGIKAHFSRILMIRELTRDQLYDGVDVYFVCLMELEEGGLDNFKLCQREIKDYCWVPLEQIEQFCSQNSMGTQIAMSQQVARLYRQNRLLKDPHYEKDLNTVRNSCIHRL